MPQESENCPGCGNSLQGDPIPPEYQDKGWFNGTHFSRTIGIVVGGVYDGVLFWRCPDCRHSWPRDFGAAVRLSQLSEEYAAAANISLEVTGKHGRY